MRPMPDVFISWMERAIDLAATPSPPVRCDEYRAIVNGIAADWSDDAALWKGVPRVIESVLAPRGWAWNGIYARQTGDVLQLVAAAGPLVCGTLERTGGPGTSGMCWDALLLNHTLVTRDVKRWPGYVSCDGESGLATQAGLVCPLRDASGQPIAVWDLDCTQDLAPEDPAFCDRLFATLCALRPPSLATFS